MKSASAILICDRDSLFREALLNFLLAAGYARVEVVATAREAIRKLQSQSYKYVMIGISRPWSRARRLAAIAQRRQPGAKIFLLIHVEDMPLIKNQSFDYVIKEYAFANLLEAMT